MSFLHGLETVGRYVHFTGQSFLAALGAVRFPGELGRQLANVLLGGLPLGLVAGSALGVVVWIHLHGVVEREYAQKIPEYLAMAVLLEFAPLGAGLVVAGRSGASLGAELSSMKLTEQIDALEILGQPPLQALVGPRVLACMLALPVLTIYIAVVAIGGSMLAEMAGGSLSWTQYENAVFRGLAQVKALPAIGKTVVFGYLVGTTGCFWGLQADHGTEGVGQAATRGVVGSILLVLVANVVLVQILQRF